MRESGPKIKGKEGKREGRKKEGDAEGGGGGGAENKICNPIIQRFC